MADTGYQASAGPVTRNPTTSEQSRSAFLVEKNVTSHQSSAMQLSPTTSEQSSSASAMQLSPTTSEQSSTAGAMQLSPTTSELSSIVGALQPSPTTSEQSSTAGAMQLSRSAMTLELSSIVGALQLSPTTSEQSSTAGLVLKNPSTSEQSTSAFTEQSNPAISDQFMYPAFPQPDHPTVDLVTDNAIMSQGMRNEISQLIRSELKNLLHPLFNEMNTKLEHISQQLNKAVPSLNKDLTDEYCASVVGKISESLPATTPAALAAFDKAIENNIHLQVCFVKVFANSHCLETVKTLSKAMALIFGFLVTDSAANKLQWKGSCRGKDKRPGLSPLLTVNAILGGKISPSYLQIVFESF